MKCGDRVRHVDRAFDRYRGTIEAITHEADGWGNKMVVKWDDGTTGRLHSSELKLCTPEEEVQPTLNINSSLMTMQQALRALDQLARRLKTNSIWYMPSPAGMKVIASFDDRPINNVGKEGVVCESLEELYSEMQDREKRKLANG